MNRRDFLLSTTAVPGGTVLLGAALPSALMAQETPVSGGTLI